jgi:hypothetical protein
MTPDRPDVFAFLLDEHNSKQVTAQEEINLTGDAYLIAVAGRYFKQIPSLVVNSD